jgi:hypothetical protein
VFDLVEIGRLSRKSSRAIQDCHFQLGSFH